MRVWQQLVFLGSIAAMPHASAHADPPAVSAEVKARARHYVDQGLAAQSNGDYDAAIDLYTKAYQLVPHPVLIFDIAQAHRLAGRIDQALTQYQKYLQQAPNGAQAATARELIADLKRRKAEQARKAGPPPAIDEPPRAAEPREANGARDAEQASNAEEASHAPQADAAQDSEVEQIDRTQTPGRTLRIAGVVTGGAGVVSLAVATGFAVHAHSLAVELSRRGANYTPDRKGALDRANAIAVTSLIAGGALVGLGATLYWVGHRRDERGNALTVAPVVTEQLTGLVISGRLP